MSRSMVFDQREELAQIICELIRDHCSSSDAKLRMVCEQTDCLREELQNQRRHFNLELQSIREELQSHGRHFNLELQSLRSELQAQIHLMDEPPRMDCYANMGTVESLVDVYDCATFDSIPTATSMVQVAEIQEHFQKGLLKFEKQFDEMSKRIPDIVDMKGECLGSVRGEQARGFWMRRSPSSAPAVDCGAPFEAQLDPNCGLESMAPRQQPNAISYPLAANISTAPVAACEPTVSPFSTQKVLMSEPQLEQVLLDEFEPALCNSGRGGNAVLRDGCRLSSQ
jgi:hypothetical protein